MYAQEVFPVVPEDIPDNSQFRDLAIPWNLCIQAQYHNSVAADYLHEDLMWHFSLQKFPLQSESFFPVRFGRSSTLLRHS